MASLVISFVFASSFPLISVISSNFCSKSFFMSKHLDLSFLSSGFLFFVFNLYKTAPKIIVASEIIGTRTFAEFTGETGSPGKTAGEVVETSAKTGEEGNESPFGADVAVSKASRGSFVWAEEVETSRAGEEVAVSGGILPSWANSLD